MLNPQIFLWGDSDRFRGYEQPLRRLAPHWDIWSQGRQNGFDTANLIANLPLIQWADYDVVHLNAGKWDSQIPLDVNAYRANWVTIINHIRATAPGMPIVLAATTASVAAPAGLIAQYNLILIQMKTTAYFPQKVTINPLAAFAVATGLVQPDGVHFDQAGYDALAVKTFETINAALG